MKKKIFAMLMAAALCVGMLAGCGGGSESADASESTPASASEPTKAAEPAAATETTSASSNTSVQDFLNTLTIGYAGASSDGAEVYLALDDNVDYGILGVRTADGVAFLVGGITESGDKLTITDAETGDSLTFAVSEPAKDETGDYVTLECDDGTVAVIYACEPSAVIEAMSQLEGNSNDTETSGEDILSTLTLGFAGASEANEELYLALDENVDYGIIGIVGNEAKFLFGTITEDGNGGLTMTDIETGETLSFTVSQPQADETGTYVEVDFSGVAAVLYACDAADVIAAMSQY